MPSSDVATIKICIVFVFPLHVRVDLNKRIPQVAISSRKMFLLNLIYLCVWCINEISVSSLRKTVGRASPILVTLTSRSDSDVVSSNVSLKENKPDGVNPNSNDIDYYGRKNEGKILWFSADCKGLGLGHLQLGI